MSCDVAALPFKVHANYGTWSIDFDFGCTNSIFADSRFLHFHDLHFLALAKITRIIEL